MTAARLLLLLLALSCASCSNDPRPRAESQMRKVGVERLRQDAAVLYKDYFSGHTLEFIAVRANNWPDSFRAFTPLRVGVYLDGVTIAIDGRTTGEAGLYVIPRSMEHTPTNTQRATFERIADGIYWYTFSG